MDPAFASARHVDELTDVALDGLPMTDVDRIEDQLLAELAAPRLICLRCQQRMHACKCRHAYVGVIK